MRGDGLDPGQIRLGRHPAQAAGQVAENLQCRTVIPLWLVQVAEGQPGGHAVGVEGRVAVTALPQPAAEASVEVAVSRHSVGEGLDSRVCRKDVLKMGLAHTGVAGHGAISSSDSRRTISSMAAS